MILLIFAIVILILAHVYFRQKRKVIIIQCDNRSSDYIELSKKVNTLAASKLNYEYTFLNVDMNKYKDKDVHPATAKIYVVEELFTKYPKDTILIFLDTDAWIRDLNSVDSIVKTVSKSDKLGCCVRDPYHTKNTYINSGVFIIKLNDEMHSIYKKIKNEVDINPEYKKKWPFDQFYISNYIHENRNRFIILKPIAINTPKGKFIVHDWYKNTCISSMNDILKNGFTTDTTFKIEDYIDSHDYPNHPDDQETYE